MNVWRGKAVCGGIAIGTACVYRQSEEKLRKKYAENEALEREKYAKVRNLAIDELDRLFARARAEVGEKEAQIFSIHKMMVEDMYYNESVLNIIEKQKMNAETAVLMTSRNFENLFRNMENAYMRDRASDIKDVSDRMVALLRGKRQMVPSAAKENTIIFASSIAPSEALMMDRGKIVAFVTEKGSENSHTAILARSMHIPAVSGVKMSGKIDGKRVAVDGFSGTVYIEPDERVIKSLLEKAEVMKNAATLGAGDAVTKSGRRVRITANISAPEDARLCEAAACDGIGIFRSESIYKTEKTFPSEEYQFDAYQKLLTGNKPVSICTLDIDEEKKGTFFGIFKETNAELGMKAIRICLKYPHLFKTQLRAILKASACGNVRVLLPMITSSEEVLQAKLLLDEAKAELKTEGAEFCEKLPVGVVIETPSAAVISDELAEVCDFFMIDADKLAQYMLAMDRKNIALSELFDRRHKSVMKMIALTAENAQKSGIPVGICGDIVTDSDKTAELLKMGIDELSVAPKHILRVKKAVCESE